MSKYKRKKPPFWNDDLNTLFKETSYAEKEFRFSKCIGNATERKRLRLIFKEKQNKFDTIFGKSKGIHARRHEVQIENMVGSNGPAMWREIEKIGPSKPIVKIPERSSNK